MYEAMRKWHGEPRGSAAVDRALAQSKKDIRLDRKQLEEKVRKMFWKDPFSEEVVPVAKSDRDLLRAHAARQSRESDDAREDEVARLRAEIAATRAENARLKSELARADMGAGSSESVAQAECAVPSRRLHARSSSGERSHRDGGQLEALNAPVHHRRSGSSKTRSQPDAPSAAPVVAAAPAETVTGSPAGWQSTGGIIVVPITASIRAH
jgi:DNA repair exonuclease SbcCD ATPase subunit